jgi:hypothetical protein
VRHGKESGDFSAGRGFVVVVMDKMKDRVLGFDLLPCRRRIGSKRRWDGKGDGDLAKAIGQDTHRLGEEQAALLQKSEMIGERFDFV